MLSGYTNSDQQGQNNFFIYIFAAVFGGCSYSLYPLAVAYTNDYLDSELLVAGAGGLLMANGLGTTLGPLVAGLFIQIMGTDGLFYFCSLISFFTCLMIIWRMQERETLDLDDQATFEFAPRTSQVVYEMYPGSEDS